MNLTTLAGVITVAFAAFAIYGFLNGAASDWENTKAEKHLFVIWTLVVLAGVVAAITGFMVAWNS